MGAAAAVAAASKSYCTHQQDCYIAQQCSLGIHSSMMPHDLQQAPAPNHQQCTVLVN
jgi:hypothetical protein